MNLARSFTKRLARPSSPDVTNDGKNVKTARPQISNPMGLISTTNQWVHEVPNISDLHVKEVQQRQISSSSSDSSVNGSDSDMSPSSEPPSMTDSSSVESFSPVEPNHLTPYFTPSSDLTPSKSPSSTAPTPTPTLESAPTPQPEPRLIAAPAIPRRAASHSKREHERLAHVRSVRSSTASDINLGNSSAHSSLTPEALQSVNGPTITQDNSSAPTSGSKSLSSGVEDSYASSPFSNELKQLDEVAEEFGSVLYTVYTKEDDEDRRTMNRLGLKQYRVSEYLREIASFRQGLWDLIEEEEEDDEEFDEAADATPWI